MGAPTLAVLCCWALLAAVRAQDSATACPAGGSCEVDEESVLLSLRPAAVQRHEDAQGARANVTAEVDAAGAAEADVAVAAEADVDVAAEADADVAEEADADVAAEADAEIAAEADADVAAEVDADAITEANAEIIEEVGVNATVDAGIDADEEADSEAADEADVASSGCGPKSLTRTEVALTLKLHNQLRKAVGVGPLRWNNKLQCQAQKWADKCLYKHSGSYRSPIKAGENIATSTDVELSTFMWFSEYGEFPPRTKTNTLINKAGDYTAMTWPSTKKIGCGKCKGTIFVCQYTNSPPNLIGERGPPPFEGKASQFRHAGVNVDQVKRMFSMFAGWGFKGAKGALQKLR
mmetsp:Transcript_114676/g.357180  ORF Transcript_114676/g.357180 Transcript_114676/m.357180 type:complete len:351 (+) Transcript_114676:71-1123(+)